MGDLGQHKVRLIALSSPTLPDGAVCTAEELIAFTARVSNPANQMNSETAPKLLRYLIKNGHWSPFEAASMTVEIKTSRAIAAQILRHRSFTFQEFSQRYASVLEYINYPARRQDDKNRQNSIDDLDDEIQNWFCDSQREVWELAFKKYQEALALGVAKECARFLLPLNTETTMYMTGSARSWIHYLQARCAEGVQKEHKDVALEVKRIFCQNFPSISEALEWDVWKA